MQNTFLKKFIESTIPINPEKAQFLADKFTSHTLTKGEFLLTEGQVSKFTCILQSGIIRSYTDDSTGAQVTTNIFSQPGFVNDPLSFFKQIPCTEHYEALTQCTVWRMTFDHVQDNFHSIPEFREFGRMMLINNLSQYKNNMIRMIKDTAEQRYLYLMAQRPEVVQNVSLKIIASYLGITDTSLSRIRKELTQK